MYLKLLRVKEEPQMNSTFFCKVIVNVYGFGGKNISIWHHFDCVLLCIKACMWKSVCNVFHFSHS